MQETGREGSAVRSPAAWTGFLAIVAVGVALDLFSKAWAFGALSPESSSPWSAEKIAALERWLVCLDLNWHPNRGAVFGWGQGQTALFVAFTILAAGVLLWLFIDSRKGQVVLQSMLALVMAGALGNLYDRVRFAHVRDFLRLNIRADWAFWGGPGNTYLWPYIFNVADVFITVGVVGLFVSWIAGSIRHRADTPSKAAEAS